jgi:hypothetical protein
MEKREEVRQKLNYLLNHNYWIIRDALNYESELIYENCHVDHIYLANRSELKVPDNMVLIYSPCNLSKGTDILRSFAKRNHLNYDKIKPT